MFQGLREDSGPWQGTDGGGLWLLASEAGSCGSGYVVQTRRQCVWIRAGGWATTLKAHARDLISPSVNHVHGTTLNFFFNCKKLHCVYVRKMLHSFRDSL